MHKQIKSIGLIFLTIILATGCSHPSNTITEANTPPQFNSTSESSIASSSDAETTFSAEAPSPEPSSSEESSPDASLPEESENLTTESSSEESTEETTPEETTRNFLTFVDVNETVYATDFVNVRADYSTDSEIVTVLGPQNAVTRTGYHEEWSRILYNNQEYYVSSKYVTTTAPTTEVTTVTSTVTEPTSPTIIAPEFEVDFYLNLSNVIFSGRWFSKDISGNSYATVNAGSEFSFRTEGASYAFIYINGLGSGDFYYAYSVDGQTPVRQHISNRIVPLGGTGTHTVRIIIDSLGESGSRWNEDIAIGVRGVATDSGTISAWHHTSTAIAFYGDSITDGIRTLSASSHSYTNSYVWYCSEAMGMTPVVCGFPGSGVIATGTFNTCVNAVNYYSSSRASESFNPSIIVVNHGTNDVSYDSATFCEAYNATLEALHAQFPNAKIACMIPVSQTHADDIRNCAVGKDWCGVVETSDWSVSYTDGIHPDASCAYSMGTNLASALRTLFG